MLFLSLSFSQIVCSFFACQRKVKDLTRYSTALRNNSHRTKSKLSVESATKVFFWFHNTFIISTTASTHDKLSVPCLHSADVLMCWCVHRLPGKMTQLNDFTYMHACADRWTDFNIRTRVVRVLQEHVSVWNQFSCIKLTPPFFSTAMYLMMCMDVRAHTLAYA